MKFRYSSVLKFLGVLGLAAGFLVSCSTAGLTFLFDAEKDAEKRQELAFPAYPDLRIVQVSDTHVMVPDLGTTGEAFEAYLAQDRKLLAYSTEILETVLPQIIAAKPDVVIASGDLTKDGERVDHEYMARWFKTLEASGIRVFVIPGNHDINNPDAKAFSGTETMDVARVSPEEFKEIYADFAYNEAFDQDPASLSYAVELKKGLWLLALDSAKYENNFEQGWPEVSGALRPETLQWLEKILIKARQEGVAVMATLHHGLVEHWPGQKKFQPEYVVDNDLDLQRLFAHYGVRVNFTGHYHSQDIAEAKMKNGSFVFDIETGSLMTWPIPWRIMDFRSNQLIIQTRELSEIPSLGNSFGDYAQTFVYKGLYGIGLEAIKKYGVPEDQAEKIARQSATSFLAHYKGDEKKPEGAVLPDRSGLGFMGNLIVNNLGYVIDGLWKDSEGADRNVQIDLATGTWKDLSLQP